MINAEIKTIKCTDDGKEFMFYVFQPDSDKCIHTVARCIADERLKTIMYDLFPKLPFDDAISMSKYDCEWGTTAIEVKTGMNPTIRLMIKPYLSHIAIANIPDKTVGYFLKFTYVNDTIEYKITPVLYGLKEFEVTFNHYNDLKEFVTTKFEDYHYLLVNYINDITDLGLKLANTIDDMSRL